MAVWGLAAYTLKGWIAGASKDRSFRASLLLDTTYRSRCAANGRIVLANRSSKQSHFFPAQKQTWRRQTSELRDRAVMGPEGLEEAPSRMRLIRLTLTPK